MSGEVSEAVVAGLRGGEVLILADTTGTDSDENNVHVYSKQCTSPLLFDRPSFYKAVSEGTASGQFSTSDNDNKI